jgi:hypothetical protein
MRWTCTTMVALPRWSPMRWPTFDRLKGTP